jgi:hypothetical protein
MKKITIYLFIVGSIFATWRCTPPQQRDQPTKVLSLGNLGVESMLHNVSPASLDSTWLSNTRQLNEMDRMAGQNLESSPQSINYQIVALSCCACGTGCCRACWMANAMILAPPPVNQLSLTSESGPTVRFGERSVEGIKLFTLDSAVADGRYTLKIEMSDPERTLSFPISIQDKNFTLGNEPGLK